MDPFTGSSTTGIAANLLNRRFLGMDQEDSFLEISKNRRLELENKANFNSYRNNIYRYSDKPLQGIYKFCEPKPYYGPDLPVEYILKNKKG